MCGDWLICLLFCVIFYIVLFFDLFDVVYLGVVCKFMRKVCVSDLLWEKLFWFYCDIVMDDMKILVKESSWKNVFFVNKLECCVKL